MERKLMLTSLQVELFRPLAPSPEYYASWLEEFVVVIDPYYVTAEIETRAQDLNIACHQAWLMKG